MKKRLYTILLISFIVFGAGCANTQSLCIDTRVAAIEKELAEVAKWVDTMLVGIEDETGESLSSIVVRYADPNSSVVLHEPVHRDKKQNLRSMK